MSVLAILKVIIFKKLVLNYNASGYSKGNSCVRSNNGEYSSSCTSNSVRNEYQRDQ